MYLVDLLWTWKLLAGWLRGTDSIFSLRTFSWQLQLFLFIGFPGCSDSDARQGKKDDLWYLFVWVVYIVSLKVSFIATGFIVPRTYTYAGLAGSNLITLTHLYVRVWCVCIGPFWNFCLDFHVTLKAMRSEAFATKNIQVSPHVASKVRGTLHQLVRDWSEEGAKERDETYGRIRRELARVLPVTASNINQQVRLLFYSVCHACTRTTVTSYIMRNKKLLLASVNSAWHWCCINPKRVLVPGAGLGRLVLDLVCDGYACQGNEFSYQMLFVSNFMLNGGLNKGQVWIFLIS